GDQRIERVEVVGARRAHDGAVGKDAVVAHQYPAINSCDHDGWRTSPRGPNSVMYGLTSSTGVPSIASSPRTRSVAPSAASSSHVVTAMRFGRILARWAKIPTSGHAGLLRGTREPVCTAPGSTRSKRNTTST